MITFIKTRGQQVRICKWLLVILFLLPLTFQVKQGGDKPYQNFEPKSPIEKTVGPTEIKAEEYIAPAPKPAPIPVQAPTGTKYDWLRASVIPESEWGYVDFIVTRESGWNPNATNPSSGAHGLPQALPYSKTGCGWVDAVCQLNWANGYAIGRYGGWYQSVLFWRANSWW